MSNIKIAIPGLWQHFSLTKALLDYMEQFPHHCNDNFSVGAAYGTFPYCIWDGGRVFPELYQASLEEIIEIKDYLKEKNISLRLIFTNPSLQEHHFYDRYCNLICKICEDENNEIVVNDARLEAYLREKYPKYSFISSTTKCKNLKASLEELNANQYKYICLDYNQNHNPELDKLTVEEKSKIEFLCNAICPPGCPNRKEHYRLNGIQSLNFYKPYAINCPIEHTTLSYEAQCYKNNISPEEIIATYAPKGYEMFKLEGRTLSDMEVLLNYARYFIKPEHQLSFVLTVSQAIFNLK